MDTTDLEVVPGHIEIPDSIELKASAVASSYIGAWSLWPIVKDTVFGPYVGDIKKGKDIKDINYRYAWEVFDLDTSDLLHVIDATDPSKGNWMRYVNCARYFEEQNIISVQQEDQVYYKAIKNIKPGEELLTWFEPRKKKRQQKWKMEKEVKEEKKTSHHSCEYCGKGFPSISNLKKHVRFHLGYRMNCLYCGDSHENVGGLRKHIRIAHPEVHKAKLINKLAKDGVLRKPDRKVVDKKSKASKIKDGIKDHTDNMDADKQKNLKKEKKNDSSDKLFSDNEISFAAKEIDDGGSRFKFACTFCKRRFSSHINMCRHRRKFHDNESRHRSKSSNSAIPVVTETPEMVALFYANVADNIALNMTKYIDGGQNSLRNCIDHIRIDDCDDLLTRQEKSADMSYDRYNVPFDITVNKASCDSMSPAECTDMEIDNFKQQNLGDTSNRGYNCDDGQLSGSDDSLNNSPHYNFENIAFGKHGNIAYVCGVCRKQFQDLDCLERHHLKKHPSIEFNFLEVEQGNGIDFLHYLEPSNIGVLAVTNTGLESATEQDIYHCTLCGSVFKDVSRLHVHIVNCVSTSTPSNSSSDSDKNKKKKTSLKSNIKMKQGEIMKGSQNLRSRLEDFAAYKAEICNMHGKQRKRVFTGCRKRKAVGLPDSPVKPTHNCHDNTGYNPNNHIRRRELTELLDTHQCNGCGVKFKTILLLERHVKKCENKEKFKDLHPLKSWRSPLLELNAHAFNVQ